MSLQFQYYDTVAHGYTGILTIANGVLTTDGSGVPSFTTKLALTTGLTSLSIRDTSAAFDVTLEATSAAALSAGRTLTLDMSNVAHTLDFGATANTITFPSAASYTLAGLSVAGTWSATQTSMTLDTTTLTGLTTLPDSGAISAAGEIGLGTAPLARFDIVGTYTSANSNLMRVAGIHASSVTGTQRLLAFTATIAPTGASLTTIDAGYFGPILNSTAFTITTLSGVRVLHDIRSGFSGVITTANSFSAGNPVVDGGSITTLNSFLAAPLTNGNGLTSGTTTNRAFRSSGITAAAGAGGTSVNEGVSLVVPSGSSTGTSNYGIRITGNGGALSTNYALHSSSTAPIQIGGMFQFLGATSSFPALKRSTTALQVKLADDSNHAPLEALSFSLTGNISQAAWTTAGVRNKNATGTLTDTTSSGTVAAAYTNVYGGNTIAASAATTFTNYYSAYMKDPVAGTNVTLTNKYALGVDSFISVGIVTAGVSSVVNWLGRAALSSPADSQILVTNAAATDFARMMFGGTSSSFPSLKRAAAVLEVRLADDSAYADFRGGNLVSGTAGKGLQLQSGTGARAGNAVLVAGTVTVTNTTVTANTIVLLTRKTAGGTLGMALTYTLSAGASFTITSDNILDTSTITYTLVELN